MSKSLQPVNPRKTPAPQVVERRAYSVADAGVALGIHRNSVYRLLNTGLLRYVRLAGGELRVPVAAIDDYLSGGTAA